MRRECRSGAFKQTTERSSMSPLPTLRSHSKNCNAEYKCMKCGQDRSIHLCTKPRTVAPTSANCGGEHLSISLRCPNNPNNTLKQKKDNANPCTKKKKEQNQTTKAENKITSTINKMMENFQKQIATLLTKSGIGKK